MSSTFGVLGPISGNVVVVVAVVVAALQFDNRLVLQRLPLSSLASCCDSLLPGPRRGLCNESKNSYHMDIFFCGL